MYVYTVVAVHDVGPMLLLCWRRWPNITTALGQRLVFGAHSTKVTSQQTRQIETILGQRRRR